MKFKTGKRDAQVNNWIVECTSRIREELLKRGRIYVEYASCRVVDYLQISRCYQCQAYGHIAKYCKQEGGQVCSHCGEKGHSYRECQRPKEDPVCVNCKVIRKESKHRVGTMDCPLYVKAVERMVSNTHYDK